MTGARLPTGPFLILALSTLTYVFSQLLRNATGVIGPELMRDLSLSPEALGLLISVYALGNAVMQIPVGLMLDRIGPRKTTYSLLAIAIAGTLGFALAEDATTLTIARLVTGIGVSGAYVGAVVLIARWFSPARFAGMSSIFLSGGNIGALLATAPIALLAAWLGWRGAFVSIAVLFLPVVLLGALLIRDAPPGHAFHARPPETLRETVRGLGIVLRDRNQQRIFLVGFINYAAFATILALWGGPFLNDRYGLDPVARGNVLLAFSLAAILGIMAFGHVDVLLDRRRPLIVASLACSTTFLLVLALAPGLELWQIVVLFVLYGFFCASNSLCLAHARALFPGRLVGRVATTYNLAVQLGAATFQFASGFVVGLYPHDGSGAPAEAYRALFLFLAAAVFVALVFYFPVRDVRPSEDARRGQGEG